MLLCLKGIYNVGLEMAWWLRAVLPENVGLIPSIHMAVTNICNSSAGYLMPSSELSGY